ncbi:MULTISPECIES: FecR family protein [Flavobacterium]|uniref:FecR family protein n=1 Tax=Flavobacterium TaxID=237 RepID=UPI002113D834|nr:MULTISPECIES: FecR family protein [Flavobacterium]UUF12445.1 FecR domain-containing protein [Flavobacterium panici]
MSPENIEDLIHKYLTGTANIKEQEELDSWYKNQQTKSQKWIADSLDEEALIKDEMLSKINAVILPAKTFKIRPLYKYVAAASIILLAGSTAFFLHTLNTVEFNTSSASIELPAGTNGAVLTLANGDKVQLSSNSLKNINPNKISGINSYSDSILKYEDVKNQAYKEIAYNSLTTPNGRQFSLVLSDGTKVYMNAGSTLEYPVAFQGNERLVKLTGEAYFEVVHNSKIPFRIQAGEQLIEDIGTSFNVNAYNDEKFTTVTLVEGSVKVKKKEHEVILKPEQQSISFKGNDLISVRTADFDSALAWKNGLFHFKDQQLEVVLKQIARWYDLEIEYEGPIPSKTINGEIYRNMDGVEVLSILKSLGVNYKLQGSRLIIKK